MPSLPPPKKKPAADPFAAILQQGLSGAEPPAPAPAPAGDDPFAAILQQGLQPVTAAPAPAPVVAAPPAARDERPSGVDRTIYAFGRGLIADLPTQVGDTFGLLGRLVGAVDPIKGSGMVQTGEALRRAGKAGDAYAPKLQGVGTSFDELRADPSVEKLADFIPETLGSGLASVLPGVLTSGAGAMAGMTGRGVLALAGMSSYLQQAGMISAEVDKANPTMSQPARDLLAAGIAIPVSAIDARSGGRAAADLAGDVTGAAFRNARQILQRAAVKVGKNAVEEGSEETVQEFLQYVGARLPAGSEAMDASKMVSRLAESFVGGALVGGVMGGPGSVISDIRGNVAARKNVPGQPTPTPAPAQPTVTPPPPQAPSRQQSGAPASTPTPAAPATPNMGAAGSSAGAAPEAGSAPAPVVGPATVPQDMAAIDDLLLSPDLLPLEREQLLAARNQIVSAPAPGVAPQLPIDPTQEQATADPLIDALQTEAVPFDDGSIVDTIMAETRARGEQAPQPEPLPGEQDPLPDLETIRFRFREVPDETLAQRRATEAAQAEAMPENATLQRNVAEIDAEIERRRQNPGTSGVEQPRSVAVEGEKSNSTAEVSAPGERPAGAAPIEITPEGNPGPRLVEDPELERAVQSAEADRAGVELKDEPAPAPERDGTGLPDETGEPGYEHRKPAPGGSHAHSFRYFDENGKLGGELRVLPLPGIEGMKPTGMLAVQVRADLRRQGIGTKLYQMAEEAGLDIEGMSADNAPAQTPDGTAFFGGRRAKYAAEDAAGLHHVMVQLVKRELASWGTLTVDEAVIDTTLREFGLDLGPENLPKREEMALMWAESERANQQLELKNATPFDQKKPKAQTLAALRDVLKKLADDGALDVLGWSLTSEEEKAMLKSGDPVSALTVMVLRQAKFTGAIGGKKIARYMLENGGNATDRQLLDAVTEWMWEPEAGQYTAQIDGQHNFTLTRRALVMGEARLGNEVQTIPAEKMPAILREILGLDGPAIDEAAATVVDENTDGDELVAEELPMLDFEDEVRIEDAPAVMQETTEGLLVTPTPTEGAAPRPEDVQQEGPASAPDTEIDPSVLADFYEILGVPRTAAAEEIKTAFRRMAMKWHPDRNPERVEQAAEAFKKIAQAWETLGDPAKRARYDATGTNPFAGTPYDWRGASTRWEDVVKTSGFKEPRGEGGLPFEEEFAPEYTPNPEFDKKFGFGATRTTLNLEELHDEYMKRGHTDLVAEVQAEIDRRFDERAQQQQAGGPQNADVDGRGDVGGGDAGVRPDRAGEDETTRNVGVGESRDPAPVGGDNLDARRDAESDASLADELRGPSGDTQDPALRGPGEGDRGIGDAADADDAGAQTRPVGSPDAAPGGRDAVAGAKSTDTTAEREDAPEQWQGDNYWIDTDDSADIPEDEGGKVRMARDNIAAIRLLKKILGEGRTIATAEEQAVLAKYRGWGGAKQATGWSYRDPWAALNRELMELVTKQEMQRINGSTANAHYTSHAVIRGVWDILGHMGLREAHPTGAIRVLEPSGGVGRFFSSMPTDLRDRVRGSLVELDSITASIARMLLPRMNVTPSGFESTRFSDDYFDVAISNVPFGAYEVVDRAYPKQITALIHDYFFAKALDKVRPGGIVAFISSKGTMDKANPETRRYLAARADFLGAVRLPYNAFRKTAETQVTTDVIFLRKRAALQDGTLQSWTQTGPYTSPSGEQIASVNKWFLEHPEMMLGGALTTARGMNSNADYGLDAPKDHDIATAIKAVIEQFPQNAMEPRTKPAVEDQADQVPVGEKQGAFVLDGDTIKQRRGEELVEIPELAALRARAEKGGKSKQVVQAQGQLKEKLDRLTRLVKLRDLEAASLRAQMDGTGDELLMPILQQMQDRYAEFVKKYGPINLEIHTERETKAKKSKVVDLKDADLADDLDEQEGTLLSVSVSRPNMELFERDPDSERVAALEVYDHEKYKSDGTKGVGMATAMVARNTGPLRTPEAADSAADALRIVLATYGKVDMARIAALVNGDEAAVTADLVTAGLVFEDPTTGGFEERMTYLSGNVRRKLAIATDAAKDAPDRFGGNVAALTKALPQWQPLETIGTRLGQVWQPKRAIRLFLEQELGMVGNKKEAGELTRNPETGMWKVTGGRASDAASTRYGTADIKAHEVLKHALNGTSPAIYFPPDSEGKRAFNRAGTEAAQAAVEAMHDAFRALLLQADAQIKTKVEVAFNETQNNHVKPLIEVEADEHGFATERLPGTALAFRGKAFKLRVHQMRAIRRIVAFGNTILAHVVGAGKTMTMAGAVMEQRRLGLVRRPLMVVPNHLLLQVSREFREMYPNAKLLLGEGEDYRANRRRFFAKAAAQDFDVVLMRHEDYDKISLSPEREQASLEGLIQEVREAMQETMKEGESRHTISSMETRLKNLEAKLKKIVDMDPLEREKILSFEELGVDQVIVDEAQRYKGFSPGGEMKGIFGSMSGRALRHEMKCSYLNEMNPGRGVVEATGTPIYNNPAEAWVHMRYLAPQLLKDAMKFNAMAWIRDHVVLLKRYETAPEGQKLIEVQRPREWMNIGPLARLLGQVFDVQLDPVALGLPRPPILGGGPRKNEVELTLLQRDVQKWIRNRARWTRKHPPKGEKGGDIMLSIMQDAKAASLDLRLLDSNIPAKLAGNKLRVAADRITEHYLKHDAHRGTQLVFMEQGVPGGRSPWSTYDGLAAELVARGIPRKEIAFIHDAMDSNAKYELFTKVNAGQIRVLIGNTEKMGTGTNVQRRLVALHHLEGQWRPADIDQRDGRILRQGNDLWDNGLIDGVAIEHYVGKGTIDAKVWDTVARKGALIHSIMSADGTEDVIQDNTADDATMTAEELMAASSEDGRALERSNLQLEVRILKNAKDSHSSRVRDAAKKLVDMPGKIARDEKVAAAAKVDAALVAEVDLSGDNFTIELAIAPDPGAPRETFSYAVLKADARKQAGTRIDMLMNIIRTQAMAKNRDVVVEVGTFGKLKIVVRSNSNGVVDFGLVGEQAYYRYVPSQQKGEGTVASIGTKYKQLLDDAVSAQDQLDNARKQKDALEQVRGSVFSKDAELTTKSARLRELESELGSDASLDEMEPVAFPWRRPNWPEQLVGQTPTATADEQGYEAALAPFLEDRTEQAPDIAPPAKPPAQEKPKQPPTEDTGTDGFAAMAAVDPFSAAFLQIRATIRFLRKRRAARFALLVEMPEAEQEQRWHNGRKGADPEFWTRAQARIARLKNLANAMPALGKQAQNAVTAVVGETLRHMKSADDFATAKANDYLTAVVKGLTPGEVDLMTRHFVLTDMLRAFDNGTNTDQQEVAFGLKGRQQVEEALFVVLAAMAKRPQVMAAVAKRQAQARALVEELVEVGHLPANVLADSRYYHRQILEYTRAADLGSSKKVSADARVARGGFTEKRSGSTLDFNARYVESEFEWVQQAYRMLATTQGLTRVKQVADIKGRLKVEARTQNTSNFYDTLRASLGLQPGDILDPKADPLLRFRMAMGRASADLYQLMADGSSFKVAELMPFADMVQDFEQFAGGLTGRPLAKKLAAAPFNHPKWWGLIAAMADDDTLPGHLPALMLLKARADRETLLKDTLGSEYVTWRDLLPKGYRLWQPVPGNTVFRGMTIAAELVDRILTADTIVGAGDLQDAMLLGGKKEEWALPENVADALDDPSSGWSGADNPLSKAMSYWKVWSLFAPGRILRVEVNNTTGDADATFNFPGIFKYTPEAAADLYRDLIKGENQVAREGLREWMELGVIDSGMTVGELRDVLTLPMLSNLAEPNPLAFMRWLAMPANVAKGYFQKAAQFNAYREGILRLAAARYFENAMNAAPAQRIYAASNPAIIDAILNDATQSDVLNRRVAAARLSRDLLGDYNNLSAGGTFVRSRLIPFYSWMELNAKRYFWLFKNLQANSTAQGRGAGSQTARLAAAMGVRTGVSTALGVTSGVVAVHAFYVLATAWNALVMGDEDDELQKSGAAVGRGLHIILGRNKDGTVQTLRLEGAWADMLEWFGAEDFPKDIRDLTSGTKKWGDWLEETAIAPVNRVVNGANPFGKDFIEYLFKRSTYPDVRNPRAVRDRNLALAEKYQVGALYRYVLGVTGQPVPPVKPKGLLEQVLTYNVDPGEAAYYAARKLAYDYMKASKGGDDRIIIPGERDNALYYSRRAAQWGDEEAAHKWYERYRQLGGTPQGARTSIERSAPIAVIPDLKLRAFLSSLSPDQRETIEIARRWHRTAVSAPALAARSRPTLPAPVR